IDSVTVCVAELSDQFEPKAVVIVNASKPLDKAKMSFLGPKPKADARGFYTGPNPMMQFHFPDAKTLVLVTPSAAQQYLDGYAKDTVQQFIGMALGEVDKAMSDKEVNEVPEILPVIKEAHRALKDAKVEVSGSDLVVSGSYKANFDIGAIVAGALPKIKAGA